jgi:hypothetical protein
MEFIESMTNIGRCYQKLVREFVTNIPKESSEESEEFIKVHVRGICIKFSPTTINEYL